MTISKGIQKASELTIPAATTIRVSAGDYTQAHETSTGLSGYPLQIRSAELTIEARDAAPPRLGGDVSDGSVRALVEVLALGTGPSPTDVLGVAIRNVEFAGEDTPSLNAPGAVYIESRDGWKAGVTLDNCTLERSEMHDPAGGGAPSIRAVAGRQADPNANPTDASLTLEVVACDIEANAPGGVVVDLGTDNVPPQRALLDVTVRDSEIHLQGAQGSLSAIDVVLEGFDLAVSGPLYGDGILSFTNNVIDSRMASGPAARFDRGIAFGADVRYGGSVGMGHSVVHIQENEIRGCFGDGILMVSRIDMLDSQTNIQSWRIDNNVIQDNLGNGFVFDGGGVPGSYGNYMRAYLRGNLIASNGGSGIFLRDVVQNNGVSELVNCTIAHNAGYGIEVDGTSSPAYLERIQNCIVWGNVQGSSLGFDPCTDTSSSGPGFRYNDWETSIAEPCLELSCVPVAHPYNVSVDPQFVSPATGDFHLTPTSCCVDHGTNQVIGTDMGDFRTDIDGEARLSDGDGNGIKTPDMGCDEVPAPAS